MEKRDVGYMFTLAYAMGEGCSLTLAGNFQVGAEKSFMDTELDKCHAVMERQRAKVMLPVIEERIRMDEKQLEDIRTQIANFTNEAQTAYDQGKKPNAANQNHAQTLIKNEEVTEYNIENGKKEAKRLKELIAG